MDQLARTSLHDLGTLPGTAAAPHALLNKVRPDLIDIVLARIETGQRKSGVGDGPDAIMNAGLGALIARSGRSLHGLTPVEDRHGTEGHARALAQIADSVETSLRAGRFALTLGGDHSLAFSTLEGALRAHPDLRVLYIDAHADINTPHSSPSGNTHGMPIAAHLGLFSAGSVPGTDFIGARLDPQQLAFIGVRDIDEGERHFMQSLNLFALTSDEVHERGMALSIAAALEATGAGPDTPVHVSFDIDVVDPQFAPATGVPVPGGLLPAQIAEAGRVIRERTNLVALDVVEVNPSLDEAGGGQTAAIAFDFIREILG